jgi:hypothetical protein
MQTVAMDDTQRHPLVLGLLLDIGRVGANLLVVLLKGSEILTSLREFTLAKQLLGKGRAR